MAIYDEVLPDGTPYPVIPAGTTVVNVSTSSALSTALSNAQPGHRIVLANGTYSGAFSLSGKAGTAVAGISVEAATPGGASFSSGSTWRITNCAYVTLSGLLFNFDSAVDLFQFRGTSSYCRITRCTIGPTTLTTSSNSARWIYVGDDCAHIRIDDNLLRNKGSQLPMIRVDGSYTKVDAGQGSSAGCRWMRIDHNEFAGIGPEGGTDRQVIYFGAPSMSRSISNSVIERNVIVDAVADPEVISVRMGGVRVTGNTLLRCAGGIVSRHGTNNVIADNYIVDRVNTTASGGLKSGGIRFYDADHQVRHNYVEAVTGSGFQDPLLVDSGEVEPPSTNLTARWRVVGALVERNVLVDVPRGVTIGDNYSLVPRDCTVRHNVVVNAPTGAAITQRVGASNSVLEPGNLYFATTTKAGMTAGSDTIWRKPGYGPRLTYLGSGSVGPTANIGDTDGTGASVGGVVAVPADVLNIGPDEGQNHFLLQYAVDGAASTSTATFEQVSSGFSVSPYFKVIDGSAIPGTTETFGQQTDSAGSSSSSANKTVVSQFTATGTGTLVAGHARLWVDSGTASVEMVVHADSAGAPGARLAISDTLVISNTSEAVRDFTFSGAQQAAVVDGTPYWIGFTWADPGSNSVFWSRGATSGAAQQNSAHGADPFGTSTALSGPIDVWVDYETPETPGSGGATAVQFRVRADSATTAGSSFPRSELRETRANGAEMAFDAMTGDHSLRTKARITHLPSADPEVIVAQLHNGTTERVSVRTQLVSGETKLLVRINGTQVDPRLDESYLVGNEFEIDIRILNGGVVEVYYQGSSSPLVIGQLVSTGGPTWYWKLGAYAQFDATSAGSATEYVAVQHRDLQVTHSPPRVDAGPDEQVVRGQVFSRTATEPGITGVLSRRWTIVSRPSTPDPDPGPGPGPDPSDQTTAAGRHGWGAPLPSSDEFNYVGAPDPAKWKLPGTDWAGHGGNGRRRPERQTVDGSKLVMSGLANGDSGWMQHKLDRQYGRWEVRCRSRNTGTSNGNLYHPVLLIWPTSNSRQNDGEYDFCENSRPGDTKAQAFMHYPHPGTTVVQQERFEKTGVDLTQWHNFGFEWTADHLRGYLDGELWFTVSGGANSVRRNIQTMPSGHGTIQLDNFNGTNQTPAVFEVDWYRVYPPAPSSSGVPVGSVTLFEDSFSTGNLSKYATTAQPKSYSITVPDIGGDRGRVGRFEVRDGDMWSGGERAEVTLPSAADVREGDERWYEFDIRLGDPTWGGSVRWTIIHQWHQSSSDGSPPLDLSVNSNNQVVFQFEADDVTYPPPIPIWTVRPGVWERVVLHVKWSKSSSIGFVEAHVNGELKVPKTFRKTMYLNDPRNYQKFGIYRTTDNVATAVVMFDNVRVSSGPPVLR